MGKQNKQVRSQAEGGGGQEERGGEAEVRKPGASRASDVSQGRFFFFRLLFLFFFS